MENWKWGEVHHAFYQHSPFGNGSKLLKLIFEIMEDGGGSESTINVSDFVFDKSNGYMQRHGPTFRQIIHMSREGTQHLFMNSTGQSGNVLSTHYKDAANLFAKGEFTELLMGYQKSSADEITLPLTSASENK
jgi:penicillin amidase